MFKLAFLTRIFSIILLLGSAAMAAPTRVDQVLKELVSSSSTIDPDLIIKLVQVYGILNKVDVTQMVEQVRGIKDDKYPNGRDIRDWGGDFVYPNGQLVKGWGGVVYPNGKEIDGGPWSGFFYPNGVKLTAGFNSFHDLEGKVVSSMPTIEWPPKEGISSTPTNPREKEKPAVESQPGAQPHARSWAETWGKPSTPKPGALASVWSSTQSSWATQPKTDVDVKPQTEEIQRQEREMAKLVEATLEIELTGILGDQIQKLARALLDAGKFLTHVSDEDIKKQVRPEFLKRVQQEKQISDLRAAEYFGQLWNSKRIQFILKMLPRD
ncbi:MAG TPA: hypothetical protein VEL47_00915 [Myxococcota bacterium]|nr:hypothetical protein [Myxococcota bacterium]